MVSVMLTALALALTWGPQVPAALQMASENAVPVEEDETVESEPDLAADIEAAETTALPIEESTSDLPEMGISEAIEDIEETPIEPRNEADNNPSDAIEAPVEASQNADIPESDWPAILTDASAALAETRTAKGQFIQTNSDGSISTGNFALNRPGRIRFDYDDPTPILIVSDGTTVAIQDSDLETVDRVPIGSTPLGMILSPQLDVDEDIEVLAILQNRDQIGIRVRDAAGELDGTLTMIFDRSTYDLLGWRAVDGNLQSTMVDLLEVESNVRVDPRLFRLNEDDDEEDER